MTGLRAVSSATANLAALGLGCPVACRLCTSLLLICIHPMLKVPSMTWTQRPWPLQLCCAAMRVPATGHVADQRLSPSTAAIRAATAHATDSHFSRRDVLNASALASAAVLQAQQLAQPQAAAAAYVDEATAEEVFESASPSVVAIEDYKSDAGSLMQEAVGSGFIWGSAEGVCYVVTNYHCIAKLARDQTGRQVRNAQLSRLTGGWNPQSL